MAITGRTGVHFVAERFDDQLVLHGTPALWRRARTCPCLDPTTGAARIVCPFCRDLPGILWDTGESLTVLAATRRRRDDHDQLGLDLRGFTQFTFPSTITPGHLDQLVLNVGVMVVNDEQHIRGDTDKLGRSTERFRIYPAVSVEYCEAIVTVEAQQTLVQYAVGTDFSVAEDGTITWLTDGPPAEATYTLRYTARPTFVCWSPMSRDEGGTKQPYRCLVQRLDWFRRQSAGEA